MIVRATFSQRVHCRNPTPARPWRLLAKSRDAHDDMLTTSVETTLTDDDLLYCVFSFLQARDLSVSAAVCTQWCRAASANDLWTPLCTTLWEGRLVPRRFLADPDRPRRSYFASLEDSRRCAISAAELVHLEWRFSFVTDHRRLFEGGVGEPQPPGETASFRPDSTFVSSVVGAPSSVRALRWSIAAGGHGVKVGAYPTLVVTRDPASWGWSLTNRFVQLSTAHGA